jgi:type IV pilus assembly protein PilE
MAGILIKIPLPRAPPGFSLIELMITLTLVGILASIALPVYYTHVLKSNRQIALVDLLEIQLTEERYYSRHRTYTDSFKELELPLSHRDYWFHITLYSNTEYQVQAAPFTGSRQKNDNVEDIKCYPLVLNHQGLKKPKSCWGGL